MNVYHRFRLASYKGIRALGKLGASQTYWNDRAYLIFGALKVTGLAFLVAGMGLLIWIIPGVFKLIPAIPLVVFPLSLTLGFRPSKPGQILLGLNGEKVE